MKFLAMSRRVAGVGNEQVATQAVAEALQAFRLVREGIFEQMYFSAEWKGAVLILQAADRAAAEAALATLPMVRERLIEFDLYRLDPYDHFQRLFKDEFRSAL